MRRNRSPLIRTALAAATLVLSAALAMAASAATPHPAEADPVVLAGTVQAESDAQSDAEAKAAAVDSSVPSRQCLRNTGSLITTVRNRRAEREGKPLECAPAFGRVYTNNDLRSTGGTDLGEILRTLDPSIR